MVKSIIKRIIVGVGIALCLMAIKERGLIGQVHALSCDSANRQYVNPLDSFQGNIPNSTSGSNMDIYFYNRSTFTDGRRRIYFDNNDSYIDIFVPVTWTMSFSNNPVYNGQGKEYQYHLQSSPPIFYLVNTTGAWTMGVWDNGFYRVRYFKSEFPNNYLDLTQVKIGVPTWYHNYVTDVYVSVNGNFIVDHYQCDSNKALQNAIDENTKAQEKTNDTIKDDNVDNSKANDTIDSVKSKLAKNGSITQLLTLPITLYQSILNSTTGSCSDFNLGSLLGTNITLPCINLSNLLGSTLYNIIDILLCGSFILVFRKKMVDIFNHMTSLNDRGNELE